MKRIGVLTSGGDAPGMNACIRAIVRSAALRRIDVVGIRRGYAGLIKGDMISLGPRRVGHILERGGTFLDSSRSPEMRTPEGLRKAINTLQEKAIEGLITIGGDGTFRGAVALAEMGGVKIVGIPGTIDNDVFGSDYTIGFDTAINTALQSIDKIRDTADSLEMLFFVEVMGRTRGFIALAVGIAGGASEILIPETETNIIALVQRLQKRFLKRGGQQGALIIVAEGDTPGGAKAIAEKVGDLMKLDYRVVSLGHVQRGGSPTARDRILASKLGVAAVSGLLEEKHGCMVGEIGSEIVYTPLEDTWTKVKELDASLLRLPHILTI
ncbi:MAG: 6-phosphofructokinase [Dehalococcoidia bacterium]|nr:ATP-dependent 6-phosphofructokinase 1 [Chloroflexota bacterium]MBT9162018.1 ATP-dependent 6-phosphofructokinase 1 [Chloroflexota bacterium]